MDTMATNSARMTASTTMSKSLIKGIIGGVVGGVVFGLMMQVQGMMPMVAMLARSENIVVGWVVHLLISAFIGAIFGVIASRLPASWGVTLSAGVVNGIVWWVLGALILMPLMLGMNEMVFVIGDMQISSLIGHVIFGAIAAVVYRVLANRA
jgi:uncharacterized membrane protein YagU involved in acid resistance